MISKCTLSQTLSRNLPLSVLVCGLLLVSIVFARVASADASLMRGPERGGRSTTQTVSSASESPGIGEGIAAAPVLFYRRFLAPYWGRRCSYYPSCSQYALLAIRKHGALVGSVMTFDRLQHEADEAGYSPLIRAGEEIRVYDPLENNDYWWYRANRLEPAADIETGKKANP